MPLARSVLLLVCSNEVDSFTHSPRLRTSHHTHTHACTHMHQNGATFVNSVFAMVKNVTASDGGNK